MYEKKEFKFKLINLYLNRVEVRELQGLPVFRVHAIHPADLQGGGEALGAAVTDSPGGEHLRRRRRRNVQGLAGEKKLGFFLVGDLRELQHNRRIELCLSAATIEL